MKSKQLSRRRRLSRSAAAASMLAAGVLASSLPSNAQLNTGSPQVLSTGQTITPLAPRESRYEQLNPGVVSDPGYTVGQAVTTLVSPDHKTLLVLTSGYNLESFTQGANAGKANPAASSEWIFVFDITGKNPVQTQALPIANTYSGIVFNPNGKEFYVTGGVDDLLHTYTSASGKWAEIGTGVTLHHTAGIGLLTKPEAAGVGVTAQGDRLVIANYENDTISVLYRAKGGWTKTAEVDLRPGIADPANATGVPGGEFPYWVTVKGNDTAYISSVRDREIVVVNNLQSSTPSIVTRIKLPGQPNKMVLTADGSKLYVAQDNSDSVAVINTASNTVEDEIAVTAPLAVYPNKKGFRGANPNGLTLSPDEKTLYVTNAGENAVAVVSLIGVAGNSQVTGLIPTGWYPNSVSTIGDGAFIYIVNGKSAAGPNPLNCESAASTKVEGCGLGNQYIFQLTKAGFQSLPTPTSAELSGLTNRVAINNHWSRELTDQQRETMAALRHNIKNVIYFIKENRTYDQVLGDLEVGNGDPSLTQFPEANTPNFHAIARNFVDFDNFYDTSDVSGDGWPWSTSARSTDVIEKEIPPNYAGRGLDNDSEGTNRNLNVGYKDTAKRYAANPLDGDDPNVLPGNGNVAAPDAEDDKGQGEGYLWNSALRAGLTVRDYGFFLDISRYNLPAPYTSLSIPELPNPYASKTQVAYSSNTVLRKHTDKYFRGFDQTFPDYYRFQEWKREFNEYAAKGDLPNLELLRLPHDHFGNFSIALNKVNTPELEIADNDYAVGMVADTIAHSKFKNNTLIFVIEDDAQDGGDHVDAHRSNFYMVGPYVKQGYVDSKRYTTVSVLRTIEDILGIGHLNLNDENAEPMASAFTPSVLLKQTTLPIVYPTSTASAATLKPLHDAQWWAEQTKGMDFSVEDHLDTPKFNRVLWQGTMGDTPYPTVRSGMDLRQNRQQLLEQNRRQAATPATAAGTIPGSAY